MSNLTPERIMRLRSLEKWFVPEVDPFDKALADLNEWDRQCREVHDQHMADLAELKQVIRSV